MSMILVRFESDRFGGVTAEPVSALWAEAFGLHMETMTGNNSAGAYFQGGADEIAGSIPAGKLRELGEGYSITCRVDPWEFGHWLGYDAHTVAECGPRESIRHSREELEAKK